MKRVILRLLLPIIPVFCSAQSSQMAVINTHNTAYIKTIGKWESGIFQPFRYGLGKQSEITSSILLMPVLPNAGIKLYLGESHGFILASEHSVNIPSVFLNIVSRKGTGGLLSPQFDFPFLLGIHNSLLISKPIFSSALYSIKLSYVFAIRTGNVDPLATIDLPLFYPRMAHYYKGSSIRISSFFQDNIGKKWSYEEGIQIFMVTRNYSNFNIENSGSLRWSIGRAICIKGGYILTWGNYPFGNHWQLWPTFDIIFGSRL